MIKNSEKNDIKTLSHSTYRCQYHIVFAPKYRRKEIYGKIKKRYRRNIAKIVRTERSKNHRGRSVQRPHTPFGVNPTVHKCSTIYGISQGEKHANDFRPTRKSKIQIWQPTFLVQRILCRYSRSKQESDREVHTKSA